MQRRHAGAASSAGPGCVQLARAAGPRSGRTWCRGSALPWARMQSCSAASSACPPWPQAGSASGLVALTDMADTLMKGGCGS